MGFVCQACDRPFQGKPAQAPRFCSRRCYGASMKRAVLPRPCAGCRSACTPLGKFPGQRFCSRQCAGAARKGAGTANFRGYVSERPDGYLLYTSQHPVYPNRLVHHVEQVGVEDVTLEDNEVGAHDNVLYLGGQELLEPGRMD